MSADRDETFLCGIVQIALEPPQFATSGAPLREFLVAIAPSLPRRQVPTRPAINALAHAVGQLAEGLVVVRLAQHRRGRSLFVIPRRAQFCDPAAIRRAKLRAVLDNDQIRPGEIQQFARLFVAEQVHWLEPIRMR
jgi:hypothetical protein